MVQTILWIYVAFLAVGGVVAYMLRKSKISLVTSLVFASGLGACAGGFWSTRVAIGLLSALILVFVIRVLRTKKWMPSGMMLTVTLITMAAFLFAQR